MVIALCIKSYIFA